MDSTSRQYTATIIGSDIPRVQDSASTLNSDVSGLTEPRLQAELSTVPSLLRGYLSIIRVVIIMILLSIRGET